MKSNSVLTRGVPAALVLLTALSISAQQSPPDKEAQPQVQAQSIPPRTAPSDYQSKAQAGKFTIAAEFTAHSIPTSLGPLTSEDFVAVEVAIYGPAGAKLTLSEEHFSLRINGAKKPSPAARYETTYQSLKDPEWIAPEPVEKKSKTGIGTGGGEGGDSTPPSPPPIPFPVRRAMQQRVQKAALAEGDRLLPQAGILFFQNRKETKKIQSVELYYEGPAGKTKLKLQ
jgi:hypothetical protein